MGARALAVRYLSGEASDQEVAALEAWLLESPANALLFSETAIDEQNLADAAQAVLHQEAVTDHDAYPDAGDAFIDFNELLKLEPEYVQPTRAEPRRQLEGAPKKASRPRPSDQHAKSHSLSVAGLHVHLGQDSQNGVPLRRLLAYAAMLAVAAAVVWAVAEHWPGEDNGALVDAEQPAVPTLVWTEVSAQIVDSVDPVWDGGPPPGSPILAAGREFHLMSGFTEVELNQGARVLIEGPCRFEITGPNRMRVEQGRLVADVPPQARLFTVKTPTAQVIDFGTEFCVDVLADGDTEVAVFDGLVELHEQTKDSAQVTHRIALVSGQASRVDSDHGLDTNIRSFRPDSQSIYVRRIEAANRADIMYARLVMQLEPIAYWPMMGEEPLRSASIETDGRDFTPVGDKEIRRAEGPAFLENSEALAIDGGRSFYTAGPYRPDLWEDKAYSLSLWLRVDEHREQNIISFVPSVQQRGNHYSNQIRMEASGKLQHYTFCPAKLNPGLENYTIVRAVSTRPLKTERWVHIAATYGGGKSRLYIDGRLVAQERAKDAFENGYATLLIGGATGYNRDDKAGDLKGAACQLAVFNRVLTLKEVKALSSPEQSQAQ